MKELPLTNVNKLNNSEEGDSPAGDEIKERVWERGISPPQYDFSKKMKIYLFPKGKAEPEGCGRARDLNFPPVRGANLLPFL